MGQFKFHAIGIFKPDRVITSAVVHFARSIQYLELVLLEELVEIIHLFTAISIPRHVTEPGGLFIVAFAGACFPETHDDEIANAFLLSIKDEGPVARVFKVSEILAHHIVEDFGFVETTDSESQMVDKLHRHMGGKRFGFGDGVFISDYALVATQKRHSSEKSRTLRDSLAMFCRMAS